MLIYLDNCCLNRPFDDQSSILVKLETDAKLYIQEMIRSKQIELAWSYILDLENEANPFFERKFTIEKWRHLAVVNIEENEVILLAANNFATQGLKAKDALHLACAIEMQCDYFLTTVNLFLKRTKNSDEIRVLNPVELINIIEKP